MVVYIHSNGGFLPTRMEGASVMRSFNGGLSSSFSSYLKPEDPVVNEVSGYGVKQSRLSRVDDSAEISIFDAKKYFNEVGNSDLQKNDKVSSVNSVNVSNLEQIPEQSDGNGVQRFSSASSSVDGYSYTRNYRARSFHAATPTASSEASWNSQTGLLSNPPGAISVSVLRHSDQHHEKASRSSSSPARWIFRSPKCPCLGKKSVLVQKSKSSSAKKTPPPQMTAPAVVSFERNTIKKPPISAGEYKTATLAQQQWGGEQRYADRRTEQISLPPPSSAHNRFTPTSENRFSSNMLIKGQNQFVLNPGRPFGDHNTNIINTNNAVGFTFPILNKATGQQPSPSPAMTLRLNGSSVPVNPSLEDPPRESLEVFRPSEEAALARKNNNTNNRECPVGLIKFLGSPKSRIIAGANGDDDVASDASSDLFEIESFSTQTTSTYPMMFHRRDSLEEVRRLSDRRSIDEPMTPSTDWYEPSEASIDWSVTTAEGFDRASMTNFSIAASEANDVLTMARRAEQEKSNNGGGGRWVSSTGNGLLSCRSEKAVSVGPHPVKCVPTGSGFSGGGERYKAAAGPAAMAKHVSSRPPLPVARSQSSRMSHGFGA